MNPSVSQFVLVFNHFLLVQKYITFIETLQYVNWHMLLSGEKNAFITFDNLISIKYYKYLLLFYPVPPKSCYLYFKNLMSDCLTTMCSCFGVCERFSSH